MPDPTYPPLDTLKPMTAGVSVVDSGPLKVAGLLPMPVRMTVLRLRSGAVLLHSPTRFDPALREAIERDGPIRHLVAPNAVHWSFLADWQRACPDAVTWAAPGLRERSAVRKAGIRLDRDLGPETPPEWDGEIGIVTVPGALGFREVCLLHEPSRTLVLTDLVINLEPDKLPTLARLYAQAVGMTAPNGRTPVYVRALFRAGGPAARDAARRLVDWAPERVLFAHGRPFGADATPRLRRSLAWLLP